MMVPRDGADSPQQSDGFRLLLARGALEAAEALLGWQLITRSPDGATGGRIIETEAYLGQTDPASHAFRGSTKRNGPMFEGSGIVYVYLSYGLHTCLNLVTGPKGQAQAVLIRAVSPEIGIDLMRIRRHGNDQHLADGPGKVGQALGLSLEDSGSRLGGKIVLLPPAVPVGPQDIIRTPRIGVSSGTNLKWRFVLSAEPNENRNKTLATKHD